MTVRLYVVTDTQSDGEFLVAAKNRNEAMRHVAQSVLMKLSVKPATLVDVLKSKKYGEDVLGEVVDLAAIGLGGA